MEGARPYREDSNSRPLLNYLTPYHCALGSFLLDPWALKLSPVLVEEPAEKPKRARKPAKKSTTVPTIGVAIRDTPNESVPKKKTPSKVDRGKGMDLLSDAALLEVAQVKEALQKIKKESHMLHPSGSSDGVGSQPKVPDESQDNTTGTDERTDAKPGVSDVPKYLSKSENESWGDSGDDGSNDDDSDENLNVNKNDDEEEYHEEAYVCTPDSFEFNDDEEEYDELYKDVDVNSLDAVAITKTYNIAATPVPLITQPFSSIPQMTTSTPVPTTKPTTSSIPVLPDFVSLFRFDQRVSALEQEISQVKQVDHSAQIPAQIPAIVDEHLSIRIGYATQTALQSQSTYEATSSLTEFELKKILLDKLDKIGGRDDQKTKMKDPTAGIRPTGVWKKEDDKQGCVEPSRAQESAQAEEPVFETANTEMPQDQGDDLSNTEDQTNVEEAYKND
ncbi:hypothetical protein Tco_0546613 [Tanacetum coccineum]